MSKRDYLKVTFVSRLGEEKSFEGVDVPEPDEFVRLEDSNGEVLFQGNVKHRSWTFSALFVHSVRIYLD